MSSPKYWDQVLEALSRKFIEIITEFLSVPRPLDVALEKDFVGLAKYLVKTRKSFFLVAPEWLKSSTVFESSPVSEQILHGDWNNTNYPSNVEEIILPYLADNPEACRCYQDRIRELFDAGHFKPIEPCIRIAKVLSLPPIDIEDIELANLLETLNQLKQHRPDDTTSSLLQLETYHGCHCD